MLIGQTTKSKFYSSFLLASALILTACEKPEEVAESHLQKGKELFEKGEYDKAILELKTSSQSSDKRSDTYYYMALLDEKSNNFKSMRENLLRTIELDPNNLDARRKLGKVFLLFGDIDKVLEQADYLLSVNSNDQEAELLKASAYIRDSKKDDAIRIIDAVLAANPNNIDALSVKAAVFFEDNQLDHALALTDVALARDSKNLPLRLFRIKIFAKQSNFDSVINEYKTLIGFYPDTENFKLSLASIYSMVNKLDSAEALLREMVTKSPNKIEPKIILLEFLNAKTKDRVVGEFNSMLASSSKSPLIMLGLSKWMLGAGYMDAASIGLENVVALEKNNKTGLAAQTILAEIAFIRKEYDKADEVVNKVLQVDSDFVEANLLKAQLFLGQSKVDQAIDLLNKIVWSNVDSDNAFMLLGQAYSLKKDPKQADKYFKQALEKNPANILAFIPVYNAYLKANQKEMASQFLDKALKVSPNQEFLLTSKAEMDIEDKKWDDARENVQKLALFSKNKAIPLYLQANIFQGKGQYNNAINIYEKLLAEYPDHLNSLVNLIRSYEALKQRDKALAFLEDHYNKNKENLAVVGVLSDLYMANKDYSKAAQLLTNQIKQMPDQSVPLYLALAKVEAFSQKNANAAKDVYINGLQKNPDDPQLMQALAGVYEQLNDKDSARKIYEQILEKHSDADLAINNLASILIESNLHDDLARGLALAEKFKDADNVYFQDTYAWGLVKNGRNNEGMALLESLILKEPKMAELRYHLGIAHLNAGNKATAMIELKQAIELSEKQNRNFLGKDYAIKALEELERK